MSVGPYGGGSTKSGVISVRVESGGGSRGGGQVGGINSEKELLFYF
jgi:hypothetical protein